MPISIYPPTLQSTQSAFLYSVNEYPIYFALQTVTSFSDIGHVQIRIVRQSNNRSIVNTELYPDGTIYKSPSEIAVNGSMYSVLIYKSELAESWQPGYIYKVQIRFGTTAKFTSVSNFASWKQQQIDNQTFSEWSTVMVIKAISQPNIYIENSEAVRQDVISTQRTEPTLTPLFVGVCNIPEINKELVDKYRFILYNGEEADETEIIESSGWLQHNSNVSNRDEHRFKTVLTNNNTYTLTYEIQTVNGYIESADPYIFLATRTYLAELENVTLRAESATPYCKDNGCINIYLTAEVELSGSYVLTRSDEKSNYQVWEDLSFFTYSKQTFTDRLIYQDFTVESGIKYRYAFQMENAAGLRTSPVYTNSPLYVDFEYSYLYRDGIQLRLMFNQKLSSFKHTTLTSKQDTLGDKYPHLVRNGHAYYAEFPISGLISFQMDKDRTFLTLDQSGFSYDGELVIPRDKIEEQVVLRPSCQENVDTSNIIGTVTNYNDLTIDTNLTDNNIFVERKFREKAEEFLNDFEYKLYRSPTEGNMIIGLMNVSLTPNATLGRMIFDFSATAYEVLENTLENLNEIGIINIGEFSTLASDETYLSFGQIRGIYTPPSPQDIYEKIKEQEEISIGGGYKMQLERLTALWIEGYPLDDFNEELVELQAKKSDLETKGEDTTEVDALIAEHEGLQAALAGPTSTVTKLSINGREIIMLPNKIYSLREPVRSLQVTSAVSPIIINYVCETTQQEDLSVGVISAIDASRIWGQVSGVFTGTDGILKTYNYDYGPGSLPYRVYNKNPDATIVYDKFGKVLVDNTNFNVYKTVNLYEIIKEDTRHQVEYIYDVEEGFYQDENGDWTDGEIFYSFSDIIQFDIEADPNTILYIGKAADGSDATAVTIGPTGRYILNPMESLVRYIALKEPQFAIINYKCLTNQMMRKKG